MKCVLLLFILISFQSLFGQEATLQFEQANKLYRDGEYEQAVTSYEQIVNNGYEHASLYYNLGNAYFKLKNIPAAILNYERAKRLAPHDEDILYNLRLANIRVIDKIEPVPQFFFVDWWHSFMGMFSSGVWAFIAIIMLWCAAGAGIAVRFVKSAIMQRVCFGLCVVSMLVSIAGFAGVAEQYQHEHNDRTAVVFSQSVSIKSSPDAQSTDLFVLHEGVKVDLLDAVGEWRKIRLADGKIGWLTAADLQVI
jgi:tetratricopeptide (TPR) repeat protein